MASTSVPLPAPIPNEVSSTLNTENDTEITQPDAQTETQIDKENIPIPVPTTSTPSKVEDPVTPAKVEQALPQVAEAEEKHDWEVVNASPSHSPSKDVVNSNIDTSIKGKSRERERSNNSTFGKDGKIGQKIDGVKKVLKSGVFGSSPKSAPAAAVGTSTTGRTFRTSTKPPVPPARPVASKLSSSTTTTPATKTTKPVTAPLPRATRPSTTTTKPLASSITKSTDTIGGTKPLALASSVSSATIRPSTTTSTVKPRSSIGPRATVPATKPASVPTSRVTSDSQKSTIAKARRESNASTASVRSTLASSTIKLPVKPRASLPATTKPAARGTMGPPAMASTRSVPARGSVGPGSFIAQNKVTEDLKAKITELEKQLADKAKEHEEKFEAIEKEKVEMQERHAKEVEAIQSRIREGEEKAKNDLEGQLAELKSTHERELMEARQEREGALDSMKAKFDEMTIAHAQLQEDLNRIQESLESHQRGMEEAKEAHAKATDALAEMRAAKIADDSVLVQVKEELAQKEQLLSQAMTDLQATAQIEERLRAREEEIEKVRSEHQQELATLREQSSGTDEAVKAKHQAEIERLEEQIAILKEANVTQKKKSEELGTELAAAQEKHDGLLLEAAQMSDARIAELSEQLQHATSLKNEAVAELEQERELASGSEEIRERLMVQEAEASARVKELEEEVEKLHAELIDQRREHEDKFASALEEARNTAVEEHSQDLILLREELTATHTQLVTAHKAEIELMKTNISENIRIQQEAHQNSIDELQNLAAKVAEKTEEDLNALRQVVLSTQHTLDKAEEENRELMAKLEEATMNAEGGSASEEKLKEAMRKLAELQDELEGTKTMAEMNKSHFATMLESIKEDHIAALEAHSKDAEEKLKSMRLEQDAVSERARKEVETAKAELEIVRTSGKTLNKELQETQEKLEAMRLEHDAMSDRARRDVETARAELEIERTVGKTLSEELQACRKRMEQWTIETKTIPKVEPESKTAKKGRHSAASSIALSGPTSWDLGSEQDSEAETQVPPIDVTDESANSSYITARAEQSSTLTGTGDTRTTRNVDIESGGSDSEASKDTDNSHYPSSLSDDGQHNNVLPSPGTTPEQPEERRRMAVRIAMGLPARQLSLDPPSGQTLQGEAAVQLAASIPLPAHEAAYGGLEEGVSFDDMDTPNASTFNQKLPATESEGEDIAETSPTPRMASTKDEGDDDIENLLQLQKE